MLPYGLTTQSTWLRRGPGLFRTFFLQFDSQFYLLLLKVTPCLVAEVLEKSHLIKKVGKIVLKRLSGQATLIYLKYYPRTRQN
ncbi:MAG: hypothetical protein DRP47_12145 [Candidatus Zixiibacteriota bacterium]|nr:MAG: hypothetical protein DRP47_12145 [candidate division Zixibacteria bacterium]